MAVPVIEGGMSAFTGVTRGMGPSLSLDQLDLFVHGRVVDTTRLVHEFGFRPRGTAEAFDDFLRGQSDGMLPNEAIKAAEQAILAQIKAVRASVDFGALTLKRIARGTR